MHGAGGECTQRAAKEREAQDGAGDLARELGWVLGLMLAEENRGCYLGVGVGVLPAHMEVSYPLLTGGVGKCT